MKTYTLKEITTVGFVFDFPRYYEEIEYKNDSSKENQRRGGTRWFSRGCSLKNKS